MTHLTLTFCAMLLSIQLSKWQSQCQYPRTPVAQILWPRWPQRKSTVISSAALQFRKTLPVTCGAKQDSAFIRKYMTMNLWIWSKLAGIDSMPTRIWVNGGHFILHSNIPSLALLPLFQTSKITLKQKRIANKETNQHTNTAQHNTPTTLITPHTQQRKKTITEHPKKMFFFQTKKICSTSPSLP